MQPKSLSLGSDFLVFDRNLAAIPVTVTPTVYEELDDRFDGFAGHLLVSTHAFEADWPSWEIHPAGDELVLLLSGKATLVLETADGEKAVTLHEPNMYVVVPKGTWHTARTSTPTRMLFVTPGAGTENRDA